MSSPKVIFGLHAAGLRLKTATKSITEIYFAAVLLGLGSFALANAQSGREEVPNRLVEDIAPRLASAPAGIGPPCSNREAWGNTEVQRRLRAFIPAADRLLAQPFPEWSDDAYLEYSRNGVRAGGERMMNARKARLYPLVLAECVSWQGKYLPAITQALYELNSQPSWTWPAHDRDLRNFLRRQHDVDLAVADTAHDLAQALYMLGAQLPGKLHTQTHATLEERVFRPMRVSFKNGGSDNWWRFADHNWNAVCLKGVVGAALALLPGREDRALFAAAGQHYIRHYLAGFPPDGYSLEGPGYWNYGVSHFVVLRHILAGATDGHIELFHHPVVRPLAAYGLSIEVTPNNIAAFGDASPRTRIDALAQAYLNQALGLGGPYLLADTFIATTAPGNASPLVEAAIKLFAQPATLLGAPSPPIALHSYFEHSRVLVSRPGPQQKLGLAFKAGGNGNHSHNDIGSYTIVLGSEQPTGDPGGTVYSAKTFSKQRYDIKAINSYGHPVPVVAGQLQAEATRVQALVLATRFSDDASEILVDMAPAYPSGLLRRLTRHVLHERKGQGSVQIEDQFEFLGGAHDFEVALVTRWQYTLHPEGSLTFKEKSELLRAQISASADYELRPETITEEGLTFQRIRIRLKAPATSGFVRVRFF